MTLMMLLLLLLSLLAPPCSAVPPQVTLPCGTTYTGQWDTLRKDMVRDREREGEKWREREQVLQLFSLSSP